LAERGFQTEMWTDPFIQGLPPEAKLLFIYLWTNKHCNQAGLYEITLKTMAFDTGLPQDSLPALLKQLEPKVAWYPEQNLIWVKNFLKRQAKSSSFLEAAAKCLSNSGIPEDVRSEFYLYNQELLRGFPIGGHVSLTKRECVLIRDDFCCQYCGQEITEANDFEVDHVIPVTRGGKDNYSNLVASCHSCNRQKLDKTPAEAGLKELHPASFHAAQAVYILKNNKVLRKKWLALFPEREQVIESILGNVNQCQSTLDNVVARDTPDPVPVPVSGTDPGAKKRGMGDKGETTAARGKTKKQPDPVIAEILTEMKSFLGYPDKTNKDPIPNYAKEGQFLKKMLGRHFTREEILSCWKTKVQQRRGEFVSLAWVNEDIAAFVHRREKGGAVAQRESKGWAPAYQSDSLEDYEKRAREAGLTVIHSGEEDEGDEDRGV